MTDDPRDEARKGFETGDFERARRMSMTGLEFNADDLELLRLAGKSGVELASDDAVSLLTRAADLDPGDARGWHDLGQALAAEGRMQEATDAFRKAVELRPDDAAAQVDLGQSARAAGRDEEAAAALARAVELDPGDRASLRSLVDLHRRAGRLDEARTAAQTLADGDPDDALAALDVAELDLELDRADDALAAFSRLRESDDEPERDVYALHGMMQAELRREGWARALELAQEALRIDPSGRTEAVLGFFAGQAVGPRGNPVAGRAEADAVLQESLTEYRRILGEELGF